MNANGKCILVIDDRDKFINLIKSMFDSYADWQILMASTEKEGIATAQLEQPDIIILNLIMPESGELDRLNLYHRLKSNLLLCLIPVIFISTMSGLEEPDQMLFITDPDIIAQFFERLKLQDRAAKIKDHSWSIW